MELSQEIINVLDDLAIKTGVIVDWSNENIIPQLTNMIDGIVKYQIVNSTIFIIVGVLMFVPLLYMIKMVKTAINTKKGNYIVNVYSDGDIDEYTKMGFLLFLLGAILCLIGSFVLLTNVNNLISWLFMPEYNIMKIFLNMI